MPQPRRLVASVLFPITLGLIGYIQLAHRARYASFHNVDVLQLLASGICFGVALAGVRAFFRGSRTA